MNRLTRVHKPFVFRLPTLFLKSRAPPRRHDTVRFSLGRVFSAPAEHSALVARILEFLWAPPLFFFFSVIFHLISAYFFLVLTTTPDPSGTPEVFSKFCNSPKVPQT